MLDKTNIDCENVLDRLVRANQRFKCKMVHMKEVFKIRHGKTNNWLERDPNMKEEYK